MYNEKVISLAQFSRRLHLQSITELIVIYFSEYTKAFIFAQFTRPNGINFNQSHPWKHSSVLFSQCVAHFNDALKSNRSKRCNIDSYK